MKSDTTKLGASKSAEPEPEKQTPMGCTAFRPPTPLSLDKLHLALLKSYILDSDATEHIYNDCSRFMTLLQPPVMTL